MTFPKWVAFFQLCSLIAVGFALGVVTMVFSFDHVAAKSIELCRSEPTLKGCR